MSASNVRPEPLTREKAIELLAEKLQFKAEHLDPGEGEWGDLTDREKEFYRQLVKWLLAHRDIIEAALN